MYGNRVVPSPMYSHGSTYSPYLRQYPTNYPGGYGAAIRGRYEDGLVPMWRELPQERFGQRFGQSWPLFQEQSFRFNQSFFSQRFNFPRGMF